MRKATSCATSIGANQTFGNINSLPDEIRKIYMCLCQDMVALNQKWDFYQGLFFSKAENHQVLELVPDAFRIIGKSLMNDIIVSIVRLGDLPKSDNRTNLSLATLADFYDKDVTLRTLLENFRGLSQPLRDYQDRMISHNDLDTRLGNFTSPNNPPTVSEISATIVAAEAVLKHVANQYGGTDIGFGKGMFTATSSDALIYWLRQGLDHRFDVPSPVPL